MDRESFRHLLLEGLGGEWPTGTDLEIQVSKVIDADGYSIECLSYQSEPDDWVPAYLLIPSGVSASTASSRYCCLASTCWSVSLRQK